MVLYAVNALGEQVGSVEAPDGNNWITEQMIRMRSGRRMMGKILDEQDVAERGVKAVKTQKELDEIVAKPKAMVWMVGGR